jgi:hypothetical protein
MKQLSSKQVFCRMVEYDLLCNLDKGSEYTGFKKLFTDSMLKKGYISKYGYVYDISKVWISMHIIHFLKRLEKEINPEIIMTSGSFFKMNKILQRMVVNRLKKLSKKGNVKLYVGEDIRFLFANTGVQVKVFDREKRFIPHFIKTNKQFNFVLPHTEKKLVRVDIDSEKLNKIDSDAVQHIIQYFDSLIAELDSAILIDNNRVI